MKNSKVWTFLFFLIVGSFLFSCNSPRRQKKINDVKLFEKLKEKKGYLNALELKRLEQDFSLKLLDKYDLSGFDEEDTLAYFVRSGLHVWIASCYLENEQESHYPFFCLKETPEKGFKVIKHGLIPEIYGECAYDLEKLLIPTGKYILISQKSYGNGYCDDSPLVFTTDAKQQVKTAGGWPCFCFVTLNCIPDDPDNSICFKRDFEFEFDKSHSFLVHTIERKVDTEAEQEVGFRKYDLHFIIKNNMISFQDTIM
ncbi:hypothetical protein [Fluviicola sp.]|uniref:hypothetical protein n=1 Tax=Fluviicola sp. TaxID=1917219 RepID=UPI003D267C41